MWIGKIHTNRLICTVFVIDKGMGFGAYTLAIIAKLHLNAIKKMRKNQFETKEIDTKNVCCGFVCLGGG